MRQIPKEIPQKCATQRPLNRTPNAWLIKNINRTETPSIKKVHSYLPGKRTARNKIAKNREDMFEFYREVIDDHKRTFDGNCIRDLIDTYLAEIIKATEEGRDKLLFEGKNHGKKIHLTLASYQFFF